MDYKEKIKELVEKLHLNPGELASFPDFCVCYTKRKELKIHWNEGFYVGRYGTNITECDLNNPDDIKIANKYQFAWTMYPTENDFKILLYEKIMEYISAHKNTKPLKYKYWNYEGTVETEDDCKKALKYTYRHITNRNLCKIDGLKLNGNVRGLYGILTTERQARYVYNEGNERLIISTCFNVFGTVNSCLYGDITGVYGTIHPDLTGDISGITGDITNIVGCCTGIKLNIRDRINEKTDIKMLLKNPLSGKRTLLSNEDSKKSFDAYRKLAHCTLGLTDEERFRIDVPHKAKPPFNIDKWGRYYVEKDGSTWVYSINPADIMFLKEIGPLNSCFCITSQSAEGRWISAMRTLMALNCTNPNLCCVFQISNDEPTRRMRMFKDLDFVWFKPLDGGFIQYNEKGEGRSWSYRLIDVCGLFNPLSNNDSIERIHGHDGLNKGHDRQKNMAYLELFLKEEHSWVEPRKECYEHPNKITNNNWDVCFDNDWNELSRSGVCPNSESIKAFIEEAKKAKEIIDGIEI